jgi:DnaD/phage-associated family protein
MARKIFVSSDMSADEDLDVVAEESPMAALVWPWILTFFDDWGRAAASSKRIKNSVFPSDALSELITTEFIDESLILYHKHGLITLYEDGGKRFMFIDPDTWFKWQTHIRKEKRDNDNSKHPAPTDNNSAQVREDARECAQNGDNLTNPAPLTEQGSRDSAKTRANLTNCTPSPSLSPSPSSNNVVVIKGKSPFEIFEKHEFGKIDDITAQFIGDAMDTYTEEWVSKAMTEAIRQKVCKWSYVEKTLKNWMALNVDKPWEIEKPEPPKGNSQYRSSSGKPKIPMNKSKTTVDIPEDEYQKMLDKANRLEGVKR